MCLSGDWNKADVGGWLADFQSIVNNALQSNRLQFTAEVWGGDRLDYSDYDAVTVT